MMVTAIIAAAGQGKRIGIKEEQTICSSFS